MSNDSGFNVLNMAQEMADASGLEFQDLFKKPEPPKEEPKQETPPPGIKKKRQPWTPPAEVMADLPETKSKGAIYTKDELTIEENEGLKNIADDNAKQSARDMMDELTRKQTAIEDAKARHGILHFQIPEGPWQVKVHNAAIDLSYKKAQMNLDEVFNEIITLHPEFIRDWVPGRAPTNDSVVEAKEKFHEAQANNIIDLPISNNTENIVTDIPTGDTSEIVDPETTVIPSTDNAEVKVIIDKTNLSQISWSPEEIEKIRKARTVELNIVEASPLRFSSIEEAPPNAIDMVLSQYNRKTHDIDAPLPASRYRATFTGLSYPEVLDLNASDLINNLDGVRMMWTIAYRHITNPSIGPWEEYRWYEDPKTKLKHKISIDGPLPEGVTEDMVNTHTKFDDFLDKTSYIDLDFILWKILCATTMSKEIIAIDCHAIKPDGNRCNKSYDWIYCPNELLRIDQVQPQVLEEMKVTAEASSPEEIMKNYKESAVAANNTVELPHRGFHVIFGHANASRYLNYIYSEIEKYNEIDDTDPTYISNRANRAALTTIKGFLIPKQDGSGYYRVDKIEDILAVLVTLDEVDWQVIAKIADMMEPPYRFEYAIRDIVCPDCGNKSDIAIEDMSRLLFIVARSLSNVQVELRRT